VLADRDDAELAAGLGGAYAAFALTFRAPRDRFWRRMTATGLVLGAVALTADPDLRRPRPRLRDAGLGLLSAVALYGVFQVGDRLARRIMPAGGKDIDEVYSLRTLGSVPELVARLALVIGPAEELFWRGFVQRRLTRRFGRWRGAALAAAAYGGAHVASGNATLTGAATVAGGLWSALAAAGLSMPALIASHIAWDVWIFLIAPTTGAGSGGPGRASAAPTCSGLSGPPR